MNFRFNGFSRKHFLLTSCFLCLLSQSVYATTMVVLDDFNDADFSNYTTTVILDAGDIDADQVTAIEANTSALTSVGGQLAFNTTAFDGIEQIAITLNSATLGIGEELQLTLTDVPASGFLADRGDQDFGLYIGANTPVAAAAGATDTRDDFFVIQRRDSGNDLLFTVAGGAAGAGTTVSNGNEGGLPGVDYVGPGGGSFAPDDPFGTIFVARTGDDDYEVGSYSPDGLTRSLLGTIVDANANIGAGFDTPVIGFYADVRAVDSIEFADDLRLSDVGVFFEIPEPSSVALISLGCIGLICRRRNNR